ncbi:MAG: LAGLIDADG family homing endonuclease [Candidatus Anstonellales archaeon]
MEEYDVLVIGAGPAGSTFARVVAQEREVLVVDKRKQVGVPVRCGEGLGAREVVAQGLELPKNVISTDILGAKVIGPNGEKIVWKDEETKGWVLERKAFDQWLAELATKKGAKVKVYTRAVDIKKERDGYVVKLQHAADEPYEVKAKLVVSAEGMEAHIARKVGFNAVHSLYDVDTCYEYEMAPYDHENLIELYFGNNVAPRGYCLTPDTEIIAKNTIKPINKVEVGEEVLTLNGWVPVSATFEREYHGKVVRITPFMLHQAAGLTEDHLVYVWNKKNGFHWKRAGDLKKGNRGDHRAGDYLVFPLPKKEKEMKYLRVSDYVKDGYIEEGKYLYPREKDQFGAEFKYKLNHRISNHLELTPELMEFFGYFISEGSLSRGAVIISNTDIDIINRVREIGRATLGFQPYIFEQEYPHSHGKCYQVQFTSIILRKMFKALFGEGCENKRLPHFVHGLSNDLKLALLRGLLKGDGSRWKSSDGNDVVSYVSMSKSLIYDIWMLLAGMGVVGAIKKNRKKNAYELRIRGKQLLQLGGIYKEYKTGNRGNRGFFLMDKYILLGIRDLRAEEYRGKVYDIQSEGSFCAFFAVHNCWIFPKADKKANVGIGIGAHLLTGKKRGGLDGATPRTFLDKFIEEHEDLKDASIYNDFGGVISVGAPMDSFVKDNFMVVGTAAKQVDPIHGGGIALAIEAAALAGNAALRSFYEKNFSSDFLYKYYEKPWRETAGKKMAKRLLLRKVLEKLNDDDLSHIISTISDSDLNQVMKGNFAGPVAKVIAKRPQLLKVLSALLG